MDLKVFCFILSLVSCSFASITLVDLPMQDDVPANESPVTKATTAPPVPLPKTTTSTTTAAPPKTTTSTTTVAPPETTTLAPETTTPPPKTTTSTTPSTTTSSTTPPTTTSTTPPPNTTTSTPSTPTTVAPPPAPKPGKWFVKDGNVTCIVASMFVTLNITYPVVNGTKNVLVNVTGNENGTATQGTCGNLTESFTITFGDGHNLTVTFANNSKTSEYSVTGIRLQVNATALNATVPTIEYNETKDLFSTPLAMSYKCNKVQSLNLTSNTTGAVNLTSVISLSDTQLEAFRKDSEVKFGDAQDCEPADVPDIVPIAVGCALSALVLVVLVAYLIGRRRSQARGYVSM